MIEIASAFATIVGLIAAFKAEAQSVGAKQDVEFTQWLIRKGHKNLAEEISANHLLGLSIKNFLSGHHESVMQQFKVLNDALASFAARLDGFGQIATAINVKGSISDQAFNILKQVEEAQASRFIESRSYEGVSYILMDGKRGSLRLSEPRFVESDLDTLSVMGLLKQSFSAKSDRLWSITRSASELVQEALSKPGHDE